MAASDSAKILDTLVGSTPRPSLQPLSFFVAWNGVLTLAFEEFPAPVEELKKRVADEFELGRENFGSRWPKVTLAAQVDDADELSAVQLEALRDLCVQLRAEMAECEWWFEPECASLVLFQRRSLERVVHRHDMAFAPPAAGDSSNAGSRKLVQSVMAEFFGDGALDGYLAKVNSAGGRESSYRSPHVEATLVCFLRDSVPAFVDEFRRRVDELLPGRFAWLERESLHVTLRAVVA